MKNSLNHSLIILTFIFLSACSTPPIPAPTQTPQPTQTPTIQPPATPISIQYVTLGSPFAPDCGDGIPRIWSNDSFNGQFKENGFSDNHGHVDIMPPNGCEVEKLKGEFIAPASGAIQKYDNGDGTFGFQLYLPSNYLINGIENALIFSGQNNIEINQIRDLHIDFGHVEITNTQAVKGQSAGEVLYEKWNPHYKIAYQIIFYYKNKEYMFSPTLFEQDVEWVCYPKSPYDCTPESNDYANK